MESLFNEKTKGIIINTPHNPIGKVFTYEELDFVAQLAKKWNTLVVSDEVYEWIVYEPHRHIRIGNELFSIFTPHRYIKKLFAFQLLYPICSSVP